MLKKLTMKNMGTPLYVPSYSGMSLIPVGIHLVRRQKLGNPLAWHYGLVVNNAGWAVAYDLQADAGPRRITVEELAGGLELRVMRSLTDWSQMESAMARLRHAVATMSVWRLFDNNCEHFAEYVMTGEKKSSQVDSMKVMAGLVVAVAVLGKLGGQG